MYFVCMFETCPVSKPNNQSNIENRVFAVDLIAFNSKSTKMLNFSSLQTKTTHIYDLYFIIYIINISFPSFNYNKHFQFHIKSLEFIDVNKLM